MVSEQVVGAGAVRTVGCTPRKDIKAAQLMLQQMQEIYGAESLLSSVMSQMVGLARLGKLRRLLQRRSELSAQFIMSLNIVFDELGANPGRRGNVAAMGLIDELAAHVSSLPPSTELDLALIDGMQKIEQYCVIATSNASILARAAACEGAMRAMERALQDRRQVVEDLENVLEAELTPALIAGED